MEDNFGMKLAKLEEEIKIEIENNEAFKLLKEEMKIGFDSYYNDNIVPKVDDHWAVAIAGHLKDYAVLLGKLEVIAKLKSFQKQTLLTGGSK